MKTKKDILLKVKELLDEFHEVCVACQDVVPRDKYRGKGGVLISIQEACSGLERVSSIIKSTIKVEDLK